ncbi:carboxypeptidase [Solibacillus sp. CAU 1738]|uniref:carboxypeptidase n=1 Tax=Solibacillus sp. CAU 1738 TaxID=3140363 RepID=UPI003261B711
MKNFLIVSVIFILSFLGLQWLSGLVITSNHEASPQSGSMLQSAVTFGGINFLMEFIYILLAMAITSIIFFTLKSRRSK